MEKIFEKIRDDESPANIVYKDEYIKAFDDIEPFAPVNIESFAPVNIFLKPNEKYTRKQRFINNIICFSCGAKISKYEIDRIEKYTRKPRFINNLKCEYCKKHNINCFFCGAKISKFEIDKREKYARRSRCVRWKNYLHCDNCKKNFTYTDLLIHKELFKKTLISIKIEN